MSIVRVHKARGEFAVLPKAVLNDAGLSWEARGVMGYLLDKPDAWEIRIHDLHRKGPAGRYKVKRILEELEAAGYVRRWRERRADGTFDWVCEVYESPQLCQAGNEAPDVVPPVLIISTGGNVPASADYPSMADPSMADPSMDNRAIYEHPGSNKLPNKNPPKQTATAAGSRRNGSDPAAAVECVIQTSPASPDVVDLDPGGSLALELLQIEAPGFVGPESFVAAHDPELVGLWCLHLRDLPLGQLRAIENPAGLLRQMVKAGQLPPSSSLQRQRWHNLLQERELRAELEY